MKRLKSLGNRSRFNRNNARIIASENPDGNLEALFQEINETILARVLEFRTDTGAKLCLDVIGRRVLHITELETPSDSGASNPLIGTLLSETDHLEQFIKTVSAFAKDANELSVIASTPKQEFDTSAVGLQAGRLIKSIPVAGNTEEPEVKTDSAAKQILTSIPGITDWLIVAGEDAGLNSGNSTNIVKLEKAAESSLGKYESYLDQLTTNQNKSVATIVGTLSGNRESILCFRIGDQLGLAVVTGDTIPLIINKWRDFNN
ncbi:hypothetical protein [Profundibacter sp.]